MAKKRSRVSVFPRANLVAVDANSPEAKAVIEYTQRETEAKFNLKSRLENASAFLQEIIDGGEGSTEKSRYDFADAEEGLFTITQLLGELRSLRQSATHESDLQRIGMSVIHALDIGELLSRIVARTKYNKTVERGDIAVQSQAAMMAGKRKSEAASKQEKIEAAQAEVQRRHELNPRNSRTAIIKEMKESGFGCYKKLMEYTKGMQLNRLKTKAKMTKAKNPKK